MDRYYSKSAVTLIELLVALSLLGLLVVGISSLNTYAQYHLITSDRRATVQNQLSLVLEYMSRDIVRATGDSSNPGIFYEGLGGPEFTIRVDGNLPPTPHDYSDDDFIRYEYLIACPSYKIKRIVTFYDPAKPQDIKVLNTRHVILDDANNGFTSNILPNASNGIGIQVRLKGCYNPYDIATCGSSNNPQLEMRTVVFSRSASGG